MKSWGRSSGRSTEMTDVGTDAIPALMRRTLFEVRRPHHPLLGLRRDALAEPVLRVPAPRLVRLGIHLGQSDGQQRQERDTREISRPGWYLEHHQKHAHHDSEQ